jgi:glycosyltransferase involved in cell wall biosynthesis
MTTPAPLAEHNEGRPSVTVALPVFNGERFVAEAIDSVLRQEGWEVHIVAVDDGSTDASAAVLDEYAAKDARISVIKFARNHGVAAARNTAIASRNDPLVAMIDQDDLWTPDRLDVGWSVLSADPQLAFTVGHLTFDEPTGPRPAWFRPEWLEGPQPGNVFGTLLAWREQGWHGVGELDESLRSGGDDTDWFIRARDRGIPHRMVPKVVLHRRVHDANASQRTSKSVPELFEVLRRRQR